MRKMFLTKFAFVIFSFFFFSGIVLAQALPPGVEPGAQAERYRKGVLDEQQRLDYKKPKAPEVKIEEEQPKPVAEGVAFVLKGVRVVGSTIFTEKDFVKTYQSYLGKSITFKDIEVIITEIKALYKAKGYLTTSAYLPEQDIKDGQVEIRIAEGLMGKLRVEGNKWFSESFIRKFIHVKENELLNVKTVQRDLLRLNRNYDLEVKSVVGAGEKPQTSDLTLKAEDHFPWHIGFGEDNQGSRTTGKYRTSLSIRSSNVSGLGDTLFLNSIYSGKSFGQSANYAIPVGTYGTKIGLDITYFTMKLGKEYKPSVITGTTLIGSPYLSWELALSEMYEATMSVGMDIKSIKKKSENITTASDQLRLPWFSFNFSKMDSMGQTTFSPQFTFGTEHFLGASKRNHPTASRAGTGGFFSKYEQTLGRVQKFLWSSYLSIRCQFQAASHTLPSSEQLQLGGANSIRGYPEGDFLADNGGSLSVDWVMPMYFIPANWKLANSEMSLRRQIEPVLFIDTGGGELKKTNIGERHSKLLTGVGGGFRVHINKEVYLRLEWAQYIGNEPEHGSGPSNFYLTFQSEI